MREYFDIQLDQNIKDLWQLGPLLDESGHDFDPRIFTEGKRVDQVDSLILKIALVGRKSSFSFGPFFTLICSGHLTDEIMSIAKNDVQAIPVRIEGCSDSYYVLNIAKCMECIDEISSETVVKWNIEDGRPDKIGSYRMIIGLKIDSLKVGSAEMFRPKGWTIAPICSDRVKTIIQSHSALGLVFDRVG